jgi:hypothetical protein
MSEGDRAEFKGKNTRLFFSFLDIDVGCYVTVVKRIKNELQIKHPLSVNHFSCTVKQIRKLVK